MSTKARKAPEARQEGLCLRSKQACLLRAAPAWGVPRMALPAAPGRWQPRP